LNLQIIAFLQFQGDFSKRILQSQIRSGNEHLPLGRSKSEHETMKTILSPMDWIEWNIIEQ
jgi:hypothetical protein